MSVTTPALPAQIGDVISGFRLEAVIGQGGMGCVYSAVNIETGTKAAIKLLWGSFADDPEFASRLFHEADTINELKHPNIVAFVEFVKQDDPPLVAYIMEYVPGPPLNTLIREKGRLTLEQSLNIGLQLGSALQAVHKLGVIHRDLKPGNVLVAGDLSSDLSQEGSIKILDFGIAKFDDPDVGHRTATGAILGTPAYMAPEQVAGVRVTPATDLYALGEIVFELITGRKLFSGESNVGILRAKLSGDKVPIDLPSDLRDVERVRALIAATVIPDPKLRPPMERFMAFAQRIRDQQPDPPGGPAIDAPPETPPAATPTAKPPAAKTDGAAKAAASSPSKPPAAKTDGKPKPTPPAPAKAPAARPAAAKTDGGSKPVPAAPATLQLKAPPPPSTTKPEVPQPAGSAPEAPKPHAAVSLGPQAGAIPATASPLASHPEARSGPKPFLLIGGGLLGVAALVVIGAAVFGASKPSASVEPVRSPRPGDPAPRTQKNPSSDSDPPSARDPAPARDPSVAADPEQAVPPDSIPAAPEGATRDLVISEVMVESVPPGAEILDDATGRSLGRTPMLVPLDKKSERKLVIRMRGYAGEYIPISNDLSTVKVELKPVKKRKAPGPSATKEPGRLSW